MSNITVILLTILLKKIEKQETGEGLSRTRICSKNITSAKVEGIWDPPAAPITIETSPFELRTIEGDMKADDRFPFTI